MSCPLCASGGSLPSICQTHNIRAARQSGERQSEVCLRGVLECAMLPVDGGEITAGSQSGLMRPRSTHRRENCPLADCLINAGPGHNGVQMQECGRLSADILPIMTQWDTVSWGQTGPGLQPKSLASPSRAYYSTALAGFEPGPEETELQNFY